MKIISQMRNKTNKNKLQKNYIRHNPGSYKRDLPESLIMIKN